MTHSQLFLWHFIWARQSLAFSDAGSTCVYCGLTLQLLPISCVIIFTGTEVMIKLLQCLRNKFKQQGQVNCVRELWREWKESKILANTPRNKQWICTSKRRFAVIITRILLLLFFKETTKHWYCIAGFVYFTFYWENSHISPWFYCRDEVFTFV